jgi:hypothetical protein
MRIKFLPTCRIVELSPALIRMFTVLYLLPAEVAGVNEMLVTSINDHGPLGGGHSKRPKSRHYTDEAFDLRTHHLPEARKKPVVAWLQEQLGGDVFYVVLEDPGLPNEHIHAQVRKGRKFLPVAAEVVLRPVSAPV